MKTKMCVFSLLVFTMFLFSFEAKADNYNNENIHVNPYFATSPRYDYQYAQPPRATAITNGYYIGFTSRARYVHSPSRLKGAKHAARINAYNRYAYGY